MTPIAMLLWCPLCSRQHVDRGNFATRPHHTHSCRHCAYFWRPAIVATVGVGLLPGFDDPEAAPDPRSSCANAELTPGHLLAYLARHHPQGASLTEISAIAKWPPPTIGPLNRLVKAGRLRCVDGDRYRVVSDA